MSNLKEIRGRISSVKSTLKITSAMRLIASAKLHGATNAIENMLPYEQALRKLLSDLPVKLKSSHHEGDRAVILVTSNQTLCGSFNANLLKAFHAKGYDKSGTIVYAVGKFGMKALRKEGYRIVDCCAMAARPDYDASCALADRLVSDFEAGSLCGVTVIYAHFANSASQPVLVSEYLPFECGDCAREDDGTKFIIEPDAESVLEELMPKVLRLRLHTIFLNATAAEHAARTLAMQIASDNAEDLLKELSLQYNKLRQQEITSQILDLAAGSVE